MDLKDKLKLILKKQVCITKRHLMDLNLYLILIC